MKQLNWYQIFGQTHTIPDGRTVTPTDDIQIWLNCADIWDKAYTTLAEVLADTDTLSALIASNNAVDYMVRSTTWAASTALVPAMTSNTTPSGEVTARDYYSTNYPYRGFDGNDSTWVSSSGQGSSAVNGWWLRYTFNNPCKAEKAHLVLGNNSARLVAGYIVGTNDGIVFDRISEKLENLQSVEDIALNNTSDYLTYGLEVVTASDRIEVYTLQFYSLVEGVCDNSTAMSYIGLNNYCANTLLADSTWCEAICNSEYFESVLNVKVPVMTSNTTPEGVVSAYNYNYSNYPWHAFDGDSTTTSDMWASENLSTWIQYKFTTPKKIKCVRFRQFWSAGYQITAGIIKASDDGANFTDVKSFTNDPSLSYKYIYLNSNEDSYSYWRMHITAINSGAASLNELQFYGREDV